MDLAVATGNASNPIIFTSEPFGCTFLNKGGGSALEDCNEIHSINI